MSMSTSFSLQQASHPLTGKRLLPFIAAAIFLTATIVMGTPQAHAEITSSDSAGQSPTATSAQSADIDTGDEETAAKDDPTVLKDAKGNVIKGAGWHKLSGTWYYTDATGQLMTGFQKIGNATYYLRPTNGAMLTGWQDIDNAWHYFDGSGAMKKGWLKTWSGWYYLDPATGVMQTGLTQVGNRTYCLSAEGPMKSGWQKIDGDWLLFGNANDGAMKKGWQKTWSGWYYLDPATGVMQTGMLEERGMTYYLGDDGRMRTGWVALEGNWRYFSGSGAMQTGWVQDGSWFYIDPEEGTMISNTLKTIDGVLYSFASSGAMASNTVVRLDDSKAGLASASGAIGVIGEYRGDDIILKRDGSILTGWQKLRGSWFYANGKGVVQKGWLKKGGCWYYLRPTDGIMVTGSYKVDGKTQYFDSNGVWNNERGKITSRAQSFSSPTGYLVLVDTSECRVGVFKGSKGNWNLIRYEACVCGAPGSPTITGTYSLGYHLSVLPSWPNALYCTNITGGYFFHSVLGSTSELGNHLSHGCVRLNWPFAQYIQSLPTGTTVNLY